MESRDHCGSTLIDDDPVMPRRAQILAKVSRYA
jgi:hypothetical protein